MEDTITEAIETAIIPETKPDTTQTQDTTIEAQLTQEISELWSNHLRLTTDHKTTAKEIRQIRQTLSGRLYEMKSLLCHPDLGRASQWRGWLRERGIPRSTADRLVTRHAETLGIQDGIVLSEQGTASAELDVDKVFNSVWPKIRGKLNTAEETYDFLRCFLGRSGLKYEWKDDGVFVFDPKFETPTSGEASPPIGVALGVGGEEHGDSI